MAHSLFLLLKTLTTTSRWLSPGSPGWMISITWPSYVQSPCPPPHPSVEPLKARSPQCKVSPDNTHQQSQLKPAQVASMQYVAVVQLPSCVWLFMTPLQYTVYTTRRVEKVIVSIHYVLRFLVKVNWQNSFHQILKAVHHPLKKIENHFSGREQERSIKDHSVANYHCAPEVRLEYSVR